MYFGLKHRIRQSEVNILFTFVNSTLIQKRQSSLDAVTIHIGCSIGMQTTFTLLAAKACVLLIHT